MSDLDVSLPFKAYTPRFHPFFVRGGVSGERRIWATPGSAWEYF